MRVANTGIQPPPRPIIGAVTGPIAMNIPTTLSTPAINPRVETNRYLATTMSVREAARVSVVSQVERSRSPAVVSIAGMKQPRATMITRKSGSISDSSSVPNWRSVDTLLDTTRKPSSSARGIPSSCA